MTSLKSAVRIVTVGAVNEAFVDAMMKRTGELLIHFEMAGVAEFRLLFFHQELGFFGSVRVVAVDTTHVILEVSRASEIGVFGAEFVAGETAGTDFLC